MQDEVSTTEAIRLFKSGRANTRARWANVLRLFREGRTLLEIGKWIGKSESTVRQLLKRAALEESKRPGFTWPTDAEGRRICDIPHPMPRGDNAMFWTHVRSFAISPRLEGKTNFCPVCKQSYQVGKTLVEIFTETAP